MILDFREIPLAPDGSHPVESRAMGRTGKRPFRVVVDLDPAGPVARRWLRGVLRGSRALGWETAFATHRGAGPSLPELLSERVDGAIGDSVSSGPVAFARRRRIPCVAFRSPPGAVPGRGSLLPATGDDAAIGALAAGHFLRRGFRHAAFAGEETGAAWSRARGAAFRRAWLAGRDGGRTFAAAPGPFGAAALARWLAARPKPLAVFAACDLRAVRVLDACRLAGLAVPRDAAVLGVDDDEIVCETADPPLSSVAVDAEGAGFRAAAALDAAMRGRPAPPPGALVRCAVGVVERASTNRFVGNDGLVASVRGRIAASGGRGLSVASLAKAHGVSGRTLELRFRAETGGTVADALLDTRLARARDLLRTTPFPQERIAAECGFCDASHLSRAFRRRLGALPSAFRAR